MVKEPPSHSNSKLQKNPNTQKGDLKIYFQSPSYCTLSPAILPLGKYSKKIINYELDLHSKIINCSNNKGKLETI